MNASQFENRLRNDARFKERVQRSMIFGKRLNDGRINQIALYMRMETMGKQLEFVLPEIDELKHVILENEVLINEDHFQSEELNELFPNTDEADNQLNQQLNTPGLDEIAISSAIDKVIYIQGKWLTNQ